jgi:hypothetical protein
MEGAGAGAAASGTGEGAPLLLAPLQRLAELMREAGSVVALTGAGVSVPSGIPDFRSPGTGLWERVNPMEVAHIDVFHEDPERFWGFYAERFAALEDKQPNERPSRARDARGRRAARRGDHPERRHAPPAGGHARAGRGARQHRQLPAACPAARASRWPRARMLLAGDEQGFRAVSIAARR